MVDFCHLGSVEKIGRTLSAVANEDDDSLYEDDCFIGQNPPTLIRYVNIRYVYKTIIGRRCWMRRTKEQAAETRQQILRAAEALFLERGYENVSLDEIASTAGASRGALHWHFKNKHGLLHALSEEAQLPLRELADCLADGGVAAPVEILADMICSMFSDLHNDERRRGLIRVMMHLDISLPAKGEEKRQSTEIHGILTRIFAEMNRSQKLPAPWTPRTAASALNATMLGLLEEWALERSDIPLVPYAQEMIRTVLARFAESPAREDAHRQYVHEATPNANATSAASREN
ncbi:TetR family transcriptional regulator [Agrobacterium pusense]|uniref:TetR family transcriptional regulator n=1 Tax=Agrobacterium pusense TaxID=648995 RepID=UPI003FD0C7BA